MGFPYAKILCPVDFDDNSLAALDKAVEIARHFNSAIVLVHVVPLVMQSSELPLPQELWEDQRRAAKAKLRDIARNQLGGISHEAIVYIGDVARSIIQALANFSPDLLVMATHGRTGLAHFFLGSVAESVVRKANCPVLTIRSGRSSTSN
jgi:universal stress protein A